MIQLDLLRLRKPSVQAALDIGNRKVCCLIAEVSHNPFRLSVLGFAQKRTQGFADGMITDQAALETTILSALEAAENMSQRRVSQAVIGFSTNQMKVENTMLSVPLYGKAVDDKILSQAIASLYGEFPSEQYLLHLLPTQYNIDGKTYNDDPRGVKGDIFQFLALSVSVPTSMVQALDQLVTACHFSAQQFVYAPYVAGLAVLGEESKQTGRLVLDMGECSSQALLYYKGRLVYHYKVHMGGKELRARIAAHFGVSTDDAERLKIRYGSVLAAAGMDHEYFEFRNHEGETREIVHHELTMVVRPIIDDIFEAIKQELQHQNLLHLIDSPVLLTGGGAQFSGLDTVVQQIFEINAEVAVLNHLKQQPDPAIGTSFAACLGALIYADYQNSNKLSDYSLLRRLAKIFR